MAGLPTPTDEHPSPAVFWRWVWVSTRPYLGYVLIGVGVLLILFGYLGVSREVYVGRQIPYVVSGGLLGVAAVTLGSRLLLIEDLRLRLIGHAPPAPLCEVGDELLKPRDLLLSR